MRRLVVIVVALVALAAPARALACSHDDANYFETFVDATCLKQPLTNTTLDALGGLRLDTNGTAASTLWDTNTDFNTGVNYQSVLFAPVGLSTLQTTGAGTAAKLTLPSTPLPLTPDAANPVLGPTASAVGDGDNVDDPSVVKVGTTYYMWYTGYPEDGSASAIFLATSTDGSTWTRPSNTPVLQGTAGAFDEDGVYGADVVYDPTDLLAPYKMWFSGRQGAFGGIGYATSLDGVTWTQYGGATPLPVVAHGLAGSADSFSAGDPSVLKDGSTWKMWYTGDDSNKKRIAYATSQDGITWSKGGKVIAPEDPGVSANIQFGAFSPTVWKTATGFTMLLTGRKLVGGGVFQTKIMETTSTDGLVWAGPSPAVNPAGTNTKFDFSNLNSPFVLADPATASPFKLYYSGNTIDANGNFHTRIGEATSTNGTSFNKFTGAQTGGSVFDVGTAGTEFDSRQASGLSVVKPGGSGPTYVGFYWGTRGSDFKPRLGEATSPDGSTWTKVPVASGDGGSVLKLPNGNVFNKGGERDPSVLFDSGDYDLYYTALDSSGTESIGYATATNVLGSSNSPDNTTWAGTETQVLSTGFGGGAVSHPSVIKDGANFVMYYTDDSGTPAIGRTSSASPNSGFGAGSSVLTAGAAGTFDENGVKDPVVTKVTTGDYRMLFTGIDADGIERVGYTTSADGITWNNPRTVALNPSLTPFTADETGVEPTGMLFDGGSTMHVWTSGVDRTGRTRGEHATTPFPTATGSIPSGSAVFQLGDSSTTIEDFRQIARTSTGAVALSMSFLQPYSSGGNDFWSDYFPVTVSSPAEALNFLLTVHGVRWRAQLTTPSTAPNLDKVQLTYAPVSFATTGSASSSPIAAAPGRVVTAWGTLSVDTSVFSPAGSGTVSGTVKVLDATSSQQLSSTALNTAGTTTVNLASVSATSHPAIEVVFDLVSDGQASPLVHSFTVSYTTATAPPGLTLTGKPLTVVYGKAVTLSGLLTQGGAALAAKPVTLSKKPLGVSVFKAFATLTTSSTGAYVAKSKPQKQTVYEATATGVTVGPTVTVKVKQFLKLSVVRKGGKVYFKGRLLPKKRRRVILIQVRSGKHWKRFARVKTSKRSTFKGSGTLKLGRHGYKFRAKTKGYTGLLAGMSRTVRLRH